MNAIPIPEATPDEPQSLTPAQVTSPPEQAPTLNSQTSPRNSSPKRSGRANGNVARLPKITRDKINAMIQDGLTYRAILESLGDDAKGVSRSNLSQWRKRGYQNWLAEQAFLQRIRARQETPADMVRDFDGTEVNHAALQLGTLHIFEALRDLGPGSLNEKLGGDCAAFARLLNALARASRETMALQKYREACAQARAALQPMLDPRRELTDDERHAIVRHVDRILGIDQYEHDFEHQVPSLGIIQPDKGRVNPEGRAPASPQSFPAGNPKPENRDPNETRIPNAEGALTADGPEYAEQADVI